ncbi:chymotrypsin-elastase inhibitor ixodidin [Anoplophora glabripennis]|uniref:chymotrypsin-elastase inhibitor ixodidin n=1 Tax=Anoplophora glabripennis TaxID=217634 RepID=UPI000873D6A1|nr:chymotrypsin-elastase inhibitor ixodidin [Anoplophora glabripennis]
MALGSVCYLLFFITALCSGGEASDQCEDPNAYYTECGTACRATCQNRQYGNCIALCVPGCFCKRNYILNEDSGKCVTIRNCPRY